jgi:hypothetical protein
MAKTVRVRIAVAVNAKGEWDACGCSSMSDEDMANEVLCEDSAGVVFVTADVPVPEPREVEGEVSDG